nr:hypothetical protein [Patescibacteria group bacterium]
MPPDLRSLVSSPEAMRTISELEEKYGVSLATVVMKLMVKDISIVDLAKFFVFGFNLNAREAEQLAEDIKEKLLAGAAGYLGFSLATGLESAVDGDGTEADSGPALKDWLAGKQQETAVRGSNFFFSPEDEEEVKKLAKKIQKFPGSSQFSSDADIDNKVEQIMNQAQFSFSSDDLISRCRQIIKTYLKGVRSRIDLRQVLSRPIGSGGLGLDVNKIEQIIIASDKIQQNKVHSNGDLGASGGIKLPDNGLKTATDILRETKPLNGSSKIIAREDKEKIGYKPPAKKENIAARDFDYDFSKLKKPEKIIPPSKNSDFNPSSSSKKAIMENVIAPQGRGNVLSVDKNIKQVIPATQKISDSKIKKNLPKSKIWPDSGEEIVNIQRPAYREKNLSGGGKTKMEDVKYVPKLTGPIDELGEMDLVNFRRLNSNPEKAAEKIKEKIEFLEEDSFAQRLAGIKAWRQSPINKMYLSIGQKSIELNKPISVIIKEKKSSNETIITNQEFTAVMELNKSLRF